MKKLCAFLLSAFLLTGCSARAASVSAPEQTLQTTPSPAVTAPAEDAVPGATQTAAPAQSRPQKLGAAVKTWQMLEAAEDPAAVLPESDTQEAAEPAPEPRQETVPSPPKQEPQKTESEEKPPQTAPTESAGNSQKPSVREPSDPEPESGKAPNSSVQRDDTVLRLSETEITFMLGKEAKLQCEYTGTGRLRWNISSPALTMDLWGVLRAEKAGEYTVTVTDGKLTAQARVTVTPVPEPEGDIWFEEESITMMERTTALVEVKGDTTGEYVTYTSSDPTVVECSGGFLMAKKPGTVTVTATHRGRKAELTVTVTMDPAVARLIVYQDELELFDDDPGFRLTWYYTGGRTLNFKSSDTSVAWVNQDGIVVPVGPGTCEIFVSDNMRGHSVQVTVVENPNKVFAESIVVEQVLEDFYDGAVLHVGDVVRFRAYAVPAECKQYVIGSSDAVWLDYQWESEGVHLFSFFCDMPGTVTVTLYTQDERVSATYRITVLEREQ